MGNIGLGRILFLIGVVICVLAAFVNLPPMVSAVLVILGLIVGIMNVSAAETRTFLISAIALMMSAGALSGLGNGLGESMAAVAGILTRIGYNLSAFIGPAALIVALRSLLTTAGDS